MTHSVLSLSLTRTLSKEVKKKEGIFFTPSDCVKTILKILEPNMKSVSSILEPSCGSGEFITALRSRYPEKQITGVEYNKTIYDSVVHKLSQNNTVIINDDFLKYNGETPGTHQLIIGNPPFVVVKKKDVDSKYHDYFVGRPNLFIVFIIKSLHLLTKGGILCFVLPKNFLNCHYYDKTRKYISETCEIMNISDCNGKYTDTQQQTIVMVVRKIIDNTSIQNKKVNIDDNFIFTISGFTIFTQGNAKDIAKMYENSTSLTSLGFKASVGTVVWNQEKKRLTNDRTQTRLIYSSDFKDGVFQPKDSYKNPDKKCYIRIEKDNTNTNTNTNPVLVINRGYGKGNYTFGYCLLDLDYPYLLENHIMGINYLGDIKSRKELLEMYQKLIRSFEDPRTKQFIDIYFSNDAINTTELNSILPIYLPTDEL